MRALGIVMLLVAVGACTLNMKYRKPEATDEEMQQDLAECKGRVWQLQGQQGYQEELDRCMVERGYFVS